MLNLSRLAAVVCSLSIVSLSWAGGFHDATLLNFNGTPQGITLGPDGAMWVTDSENAAIVRRAADGSFRSFPVEGSFGGLGPIVPGPDGNLWFIEYFSAFIGRATLGGQVTAFSVPTLQLGDIAGGPDGNVWFTTATASPEIAGTQGGSLDGALGRITPSGTVSIFPVQREAALFLAEGPDNALWVSSFDSIGRVTTGGQSQFFPVETVAGDIAAGPDGALWFTSRCFFLLQAGLAGLSSPCRYGIGRLTTDGELTRFLEGEANANTVSITRGPEDNLWFTRGDGRISRLNLAGRVDDIVFLSEGVATDITTGSDGDLWYVVRPDDPFVDQSRNRIGKVNSLVFDGISIANGGPWGMAPGLNGSVWFTDLDGNRVGRLDSNGGLIQYELGADRGPTAIAAAPDGGAWFTNFDNGTIGRITPDGEFVEFALPFPDDLPGDIVRGPDGNFWFIAGISSIGRITPQGGVRIFPLPSDEAVPVGITAGPDGNLWFTEYVTNKIGRMTPDGTIVEFPIPTADSGPVDITTGPDGALYFTQSAIGRIGRITTSGAITQVDLPHPLGSPRDIATGPDGALWFSIAPAEFDTQLANATDAGSQPQGAEVPPSQLGRMARDGRVTTFDLPFDEANPGGIAGSSNGRLFVALYDSSRIAAIDLVAAEPTPTATPTSRTPVATPTASGSCASDCNGNRVVSINELIAVVNIALGIRAVETCPAGDVNGDGTVSINELITAVGRALRGC